jgi:hypothetical protein
MTMSSFSVPESSYGQWRFPLPQRQWQQVIDLHKYVDLIPILVLLTNFPDTLLGREAFNVMLVNHILKSPKAVILGW